MNMMLRGVPSGSRSGDAESATSAMVPSFRLRPTSRPVKVSPAKTRSQMVRASAASSSGTVGRGRPIVSAAVQPNTCSAAGFQVRTVPFRSTVQIASSEKSTIAWKLAVVLRRASSAVRRSVMSDVVPTRPSSRSPSRMSAALTLTQTTSPPGFTYRCSLA